MDKAYADYVAELARLASMPTDAAQTGKPEAEYGRNPWLFRSVKLCAEAIASLPVQTVNRVGDVIPIREIDGLLQGPARGVDTYTHFLAVASWLKLCGKALVYKGTMTGQRETELARGESIVELVVMNPNEWSPVVDEKGVLQAWQCKGERTHPSRMIPLLEWSPTDPYDGVGAGDAAAIALSMDYWAQAWNAEGFRKGGAHNRLVFTTPKAIRSNAILKQWRRGLDALYAGVRNAHRSIIAHDGMEVKELGGSARDMEFGLMRNRAREDVIAAAGALPGMVGVLEHSNYSNMDVQDRLFWKVNVRPTMRLIESAYTLHLVAIYDPSASLRFDVSSVEALQPDIGKALENASKMKGHLTANEIRAYLRASGVLQIERADVPGGDVLLASFSDVPLEVVAQPESDPPPDTGDDVPDRSAAEFFGKAEYLVPSGLSKQVNERKRARMARRFAGEIRGVLGRTERQLVRDLSRGVDVALENARERTHEDALDTLLATHRREISARANQQLEELRSRERLTGEDLRSGVIAEYLEQRSMTFADSWTSTVVDRVERSLRNGQDDGEDTAGLRSRVRSVIGSERVRARWVAHTEATSTFGAANDFAYNLSGVVKSKQWLSAQDGAVRDSHAAADGQIVPVDDAFTVGGATLRWPGDPAAPIEETINCRCTTAPAEIGGE